MTGLMTAARMYSAGRIDIEERELPALAAGELLVRVHSAGVCGSDIAIYEGDFASRIELPRILGHEWSGVVAATGADVEGFLVGDRVVSEEIFWCGTCATCRRGHFDYCERPEELGFTLDGAYATHLVVPARRCHHVPTGVRLDAAALVEPLAVAYNAIFLSGPGVQPGERVAVTGMGPIGLAAGLWARASGAEVVGVEPRAFRRELGALLGFHQAIASPDTLLHAARDVGGFDLLIEAAGDHRPMDTLVRCLRPRGTIVTVGHTTRSTNVWLEPVTLAGLHLVGSIGQIGTNAYVRVLHALELGVVDPTPMITHRFPLAEAADAMRFAASSADFGKIQLLAGDGD